jgi:copper chaperone
VDKAVEARSCLKGGFFIDATLLKIDYIRYDYCAYLIILGETNMSESSELTVTGMKCGGCENTVKGKLQSVDGIKAVSASFKTNTVSVEFNSAVVNLDTIKSVITEAGFSVE